MSGEEKEKIKILQVANISSAASRDHVYNMFNYLGKIQELKVYPSEGNISYNTSLKTAFIKFDDERCAEVGQHLTNTVLIDRAVVCLPYPNPVIPDEESFFNSGGSTTAGQRQLPPHVTNKIVETEDGNAMLITVDPTLEQLGLPAYPSLPGDSDPAKVEEIRRTVYVGNLPKGVDGQEVLDLFNMYFGEVMYVRMASGPAALPCAYAYVEFSQQASVSNALQNDGFEFKERPLKIQHSRVAIIKPQAKTDEQALGEIEEAIRLGKSADDRSDRRRSRSPRRRRSPSPRRRRDSRERDRDRDRDRRRSRDRDRDRDRKRSRSRDRDRKRRSRSRDKDTKKRSRSRDRDRDRDRRRRSKSREKRRDRSRSRSRDRKRDKKRSRSRSTDRKREKDDRKSDKKDEKKENEHESTLREKLLEKKAARKDSSEDEWEEKQQPDADVKMDTNGNGDSHEMKTEVN